jgi:hypothetical protein
LWNISIAPNREEIQTRRNRKKKAIQIEQDSPTAAAYCCTASSNALPNATIDARANGSIARCDV